jgi:hypothetical protein
VHHAGSVTVFRRVLRGLDGRCRERENRRGNGRETGKEDRQIHPLNLARIPGEGNAKSEAVCGGRGIFRFAKLRRFPELGGVSEPIVISELFPRFPACPGLPPVERRLGWESMTPHRESRGEAFYRAALRYAQSLWMEGKPAQAMLQLNKAWSADLRGDEPVLREWPPPYRPLCRMLEGGAANGFFGNPVRHFQHLATRMSGPRAEARRWRAWACFQLAERRLDSADFPRDADQVARERPVFPTADEIGRGLAALGWPDEAGLFAELIESDAARA